MYEGINSNTKNNDGQTPLHFAALHGHLSVVQLLLTRSDIVVNCLDLYEYARIYIAALYGHWVIVQTLLSHDGIDVNVEDKWGRTPLWAAVHGGDLGVAGVLLSRKDTDVNVVLDNFGRTSLGAVIHDSQLEMAKLLLTRDDIDVEVPGKDGLTPLDLAESLVESIPSKEEWIPVVARIRTIIQKRSAAKSG